MHLFTLSFMIVFFIDAGVYNVEYSPPPVGGGIKSNGLEMGKKIKSLKKRKKESFEDLTLLAVPKGKM